MLPMRLKIGTYLRTNRCKPNRVDITAVCRLLNDFSIKILGSEILIYIKQVHLEIR